MIKLQYSVKFNKTKDYLKKITKLIDKGRFDHYGQLGVKALRSNTPKDSGKTSESWRYSVYKSDKFASLTFHNDNIVDGVPIAIIIQYGHGTRNGGYVQGRDYINPSVQPIFDKMSQEIWKEVSSL